MVHGDDLQTGYQTQMSSNYPQFVHGLDVSVYQDDNTTPQKIDFKKTRAAGARFVYIRAAFGTAVDEDFYDNWRAAKAAGLFPGAYCFWDYRAVKASVQVARWMALLASVNDGLPPAIDVEQANSSWPALPASPVVLDAIWQFQNAAQMILKRKTGVLYSNPSSILSRMIPAPDWLTAMPLWCANWYCAPEWILTNGHWTLPWKRWTFWQQGLGKGQGPGYGVESKDIDKDYFNGSIEDLKIFAGVSIPAPEPEPEEPEEEEPMGLYSDNARGVFVQETHTKSDFTALKDQIDFVVCYAGHGDEEVANFRENVAAAHKAGLPALAYVALKPDLYQGMGFDPAKFPKGLTEKHVKMLRDALHYDSGKSETVEGVILDVSDYVMEDGKTQLTPTWAGGLLEHITNELFDQFKKPVYPLVKTGKGSYAEHFNGSQYVVGALNRLGGSVSVVRLTSIFITVGSGYKIPADTAGPVPPFVEPWDFWWYGAQSFSGLAKAAVLMLSSKTRAGLWKELNFTGATTPTEPEPPDPDDPSDDDIPVDIKVILANLESMRALINGNHAEIMAALAKEQELKLGPVTFNFTGSGTGTSN